MNIFKKQQQIKYIVEHSDPYATELLGKYIHQFINQYVFKHWVIVCIGTDRSTGDALGPLVGSKLKLMEPKDFVVFGTLDEPIHALNIEETLQFIQNTYPRSGIIAIDASLGQINSVGTIQVQEGPLKPGAGVKKNLPEIGHFHITGIVNVGGFMEYFVLQNTRLNLVMKMSELISNSIDRINTLNKYKKENAVNE